MSTGFWGKCDELSKDGLSRSVGKESRNGAESAREVRRRGQPSQQAHIRLVAVKGREEEGGARGKHGVKRKDHFSLNERLDHV